MSKKEQPLGCDIKLRFDQIGADLSFNSEGDLDNVSGEDNLAQAIICRLSTSEGELYDTGHANYGSRLFEVVGEIFNESTRQRIKALVRDCLTQETRIKKIARIDVSVDPFNRSLVNIELTVLPISGSSYLTITYPFRLEG